MKVLLLTVTMDGNGGGDHVQHWVCATREACFKVLRDWVDEQNQEPRSMDGETGDCTVCGALHALGETVKDETTDAEDFHCYICIDKVTDPVEAYFATSEDLYEIDEYEVQA